MPATDKLIVTNYAVFGAKYGPAGLTALQKAVKKLVTADAGRGIISAVVDLSDPAAMTPSGAPVVAASSAGDAKLNKEAIDKVFVSYDVRPAYLLLLGSVEVIPHVPLDNPMLGDGDPDLPSDLPYACDVPYSTNVQDFIAPTRVVGRLPNVTGDKKPDYLIKLLKNAAAYTSRPTVKYHPFLGVTAQVWTVSTQLSLNSIFGTSAGMKISPPDGPTWTAAEAKRLSHFVNCHGAPGDPQFYGQKGNSYPAAHSAAKMATKVAAGTVMAAECCYGAELYDPVALGVHMSMCHTYLGRNAYAFLGSSNIAYGPSASNDQADLLCQYFLRGVVTGASAGRACLQARLKYVSTKAGLLTPTDLKTLGQFNLMGDPSLTPVSAAGDTHVIPMAGETKTRAIMELARQSRFGRRAGLLTQAAATHAFRLVESAVSLGAKTGALAKLKQMASKMGIKDPDAFVTFGVGPSVEGIKTMATRALSGEATPQAVHAIIKKLEAPAKVPHLRLVHGVQAIEYMHGMEAKEFLSR